jgi:hypothetical protein
MPFRFRRHTRHVGITPLTAAGSRMSRAEYKEWYDAHAWQPRPDSGLVLQEDLSCSPNFWWPDDRAWCWSTDTDFTWGYLAASAACMSEVLAAAVLDAYPTMPGSPAHQGMDVINAIAARNP